MKRGHLWLIPAALPVVVLAALFAIGISNARTSMAGEIKQLPASVTIEELRELARVERKQAE